MAGRPNRLWERQFISEWAAKTYPTEEIRFEQRLGSTPVVLADFEMSDGERAMLSRWYRYVDAAVLLPDRIVLIEAAILPDLKKIGQLELYSGLVPHTEELAAWRELPVEMVLLYAIPDPVVLTMARQRGIRTVQYTPSFIDEWLRARRPNMRRAPVVGSEALAAESEAS